MLLFFVILCGHFTCSIKARYRHPVYEKIVLYSYIVDLASIEKVYFKNENKKVKNYYHSKEKKCTFWIYFKI